MGVSERPIGTQQHAGHSFESCGGVELGIEKIKPLLYKHVD